MSLTVRQRAEVAGTLRFIHVHLMETLARWVPTTPELEVKVLFGRHIWDEAQHADVLGKRAFELRAPLHHTVRPPNAWIRALEELSRFEETADRLRSFYDGVLLELAVSQRRYLDETDDLLDEPTVLILARILEDQARMKNESENVRDQLPALRLEHTGDPEVGSLDTLLDGILGSVQA